MLAPSQSLSYGEKAITNILMALSVFIISVWIFAPNHKLHVSQDVISPEGFQLLFLHTRSSDAQAFFLTPGNIYDGGWTVATQMFLLRHTWLLTLCRFIVDWCIWMCGCVYVGVCVYIIINCKWVCTRWQWYYNTQYNTQKTQKNTK